MTNPIELNQKLLDFKIKLAFKQSFNSDELKVLFNLYNEVTGEKKHITSCSSCVASVISRLKAECRKREIR